MIILIEGSASKWQNITLKWAMTTCFNIIFKLLVIVCLCVIWVTDKYCHEHTGVENFFIEVKFYNAASVSCLVDTSLCHVKGFVFNIWTSFFSLILSIWGHDSLVSIFCGLMLLGVFAPSPPYLKEFLYLHSLLYSYYQYHLCWGKRTAEVKM
jgi:hypothetical protein